MLSWYDCNLWVGRTVGLQGTGQGVPGLDALQTVLARVRVRGGLVTHVQSAESAPGDGNRLLDEAMALQDGEFDACWVGLPPWTEELPPPAEWVETLRRRRVAAVRLMPSMAGHRYALTPWVLDPLLSRLEALGIPVVLDFQLFRRAEPDWRGLFEVLSTYPNLDVLLVQVRPRNNRTLFALLDRFPRLYVETGGFNVHGGLEWVCRRFGADRLVFGSGYPFSPLGAAKLQVERADLEPGWLRQIVQDNYLRLFRSLGGAADARIPAGAGVSSEVGERGPKAPPTDYALIVDAHAHLGPFRHFHIPDADAAGMVRVMDRGGIDVAIVASNPAISADYRVGNALVRDAIRQYPDRFRGYCVVNPNYPWEMREEIARALATEGVVGFKIHPELHGDYPLTGRNWQPMWEAAEERGLPVLTHTYFGGDGVDRLAQVAARYPRVPLIVGHAGFDLGLEVVVDMARSLPNVYLDLTGQPLHHEGIVQYLVAELGPERLLFGSDMPFINGVHQLGTLVYAGLPHTVVERIVGGNARRLFRLDRSVTPGEGVADPGSPEPGRPTRPGKDGISA